MKTKERTVRAVAGKDKEHLLSYTAIREMLWGDEKADGARKAETPREATDLPEGRSGQKETRAVVTSIMEGFYGAIFTN